MVDRRKLQNIALALPLFGAAMILPPVVLVFAPDVRVFGTPVIVIYLFGIWLCFILTTFFLSRRLKQSQQIEIEPIGTPSAGQDGPL